MPPADRLAAVLHYCEARGLDADEPPWDVAAIAVPFVTLDADERLHWDADVDALVLASARYRPVHVDYLHRYVICQREGLHT